MRESGWNPLWLSFDSFAGRRHVDAEKITVLTSKHDDILRNYFTVGEVSEGNLFLDCKNRKNETGTD
eukprot:1008507-Amphidinium_carterae.1